MRFFVWLVNVVAWPVDRALDVVFGDEGDD